MSTAVIIARFQTPYLHEGHLNLLNQVKAKHEKLLVVLGISPIKGSRKNPYDYYTREKMLKHADENLIVLPLSDHPSDTAWSRNLDDLLKGTFPTEQFVLYGSRDSFIPFYSGKLETVELPEHGTHNATELRQQYAEKVLNSVDFRAGILYAYHNQYPKVYPTVDIAVFDENKQRILLGLKANSNKWRLIGGFCDPEDNQYEVAALRELQEECGPIKVDDLNYETSTKIDDWRYRSELDKIITTMFSCNYIGGTPEPNDDLVNLKWFDFKKLTLDEITPEHHELIQFLINKYK